MEPSIKDSDSEQDEHSVDSAKGPIFVMISDPIRMLHCCVCFRPFRQPVLVCEGSHVMCHTCGGNKCPKCSWNLQHNRAFENLLNSMIISCAYQKHGCMKKMSYIESKNHKCTYVPCFCPLSGCDFIAPSKVLSDHFIHKHRNFQIPFLYDVSFTVSLKSFDEAIILQEQNDGKLFIVNPSNVHMGNAVNISLIGPEIFLKGHRYDILARSSTNNLKLESFTESIQQVTLKPLSSEFLEIPFGFFGSSEPLKLDICIKSKYCSSNSVMESSMKDSDSEQGEYSVDSAKGPVFAMISDPTVLDCCYCLQPTRRYYAVCDLGHVLCNTCRCRLKKCPKCSRGLQRDRAFNSLFYSMYISCPYEIHGCMNIMGYIELKNHKCTYVPCFCPLPGCDFVAPSKVLYDHFIHKHRNFRIPFLYDVSFVVSLKSSDEVIILQEQNDGKLFIVNRSNVRTGTAINISLIGPKISVKGYHYDILARSPTKNLKLRSFTKSIQQVTLKPLSSEFLEIPFGFFGFSEPFKLEICIKSKMQIFVKTLSQRKIPLEVESVDTIGDVKQQIQDKVGMPIDDQRLILDYGFKRTELHFTVADYNINEDTALLLMHGLE